MADSRVLEIIIRAKDEASKVMDSAAKKAGGLSAGAVAAGIGAGGLAVATATAAALNKAADAAQNYGGQVITIQRLTGASAQESSKAAAVFSRFGIEGKAVGTVMKTLATQITADTSARVVNQAAVEKARIKLAELTRQEQLATGEQKLHLQSQVALAQVAYSEAAQGKIKGTASALQQMGIATKDSSGHFRTQTQVLADVAEWYKKSGGGAEANAMAAKVLGKNYMQLLPVLASGKAGIDGITASAEKNGLVMDQAQLQAVKDYGKAQKDNAEAMKGMEVQVGAAVLPIKTEMVRAIGQVFSWLNSHKGEIVAWVKGVYAGAKPIIDALKVAFGVWLNAATAEFKFFQAAISAAWAFMQPVLAEMGRIVMSSLVPAFEDLKKAWAELRPQIEPLIPYLKIAAAVIAGVLFFAIVGIVIVLAKLAQGLAFVARFAVEFGTAIAQGAVSAVLAFRKFITDVPTLLSQLPGKVAYWIGFAGGQMTKKTGDAINFTLDYWKKMPGRVLAFLQALPGQLFGFFVTVGKTMNGVVTNVVNTVVGIFQQIPVKLLAIVQSLPGILFNALAGLGKAGLDVGAAIWNGFKDGMGIHSPSHIERALTQIVAHSARSLHQVRSDITGFSRLTGGAQLVGFSPVASSGYTNGGTITGTDVVMKRVLSLLEKLEREGVRTYIDGREVSRSLGSTVKHTARGGGR